MKRRFAPALAALLLVAVIAGGALAQGEGQASNDKTAKHPQTPATSGKVPNEASPNGPGTVPGVSPSSPYASPPPASGPSATSPSATPPSVSVPSTAGTAGTENKDVIREAQVQLQAAGFTPGPVTGTMDQQTRDAIRQFQQAKGLAVTGDLDQDTRSALLSGSAAGTAPGSNK